MSRKLRGYSADVATDTLWARVEETFGEDPKLVPTITAINFGNPWLMNEVEPNAKAVFVTFGTKSEALLDVIRGRYNPTGKLPITIPANAEAVANDRGDVPGFDEGPDYVYKAANGDAYGYNFGLSYEEREQPKISEIFRKIFGKDKDD
ncbi:glycoside hydrolase family 3 C-terminal domain-containing protein [Pallidibacillus pasinlerensis]|uniref:beta-glucosidase n=1 Tax=Pallidibacillus pasinlerensis TaxID=2703818 RepID=A0ABX0A5A8_9BACI|nr:glycoside hydrolase family 3 C-terminal domain-containing protein [Pallidibacillus pasinlerensis]NCU18620.1 glycoside hydrolase family 3 protein [Pallidibacillus pasinlerensis]